MTVPERMLFKPVLRVLFQCHNLCFCLYYCMHLVATSDSSEYNFLNVSGWFGGDVLLVFFLFFFLLSYYVYVSLRSEFRDVMSVAIST